MAFWDRFKKQKRPTGRRNFTAAGFGRLFNDWNASNSSPDQELENNLKVLRDRSRDYRWLVKRWRGTNAIL